MESIILRKKEKRVGLVIHTGTTMFANGIIQNAYFMIECFKKIGIETTLLTTDDAAGVLDYKDIPIKKLSTNLLEFDPSEYHTIITVTRGMGSDLYTHLKSHKIAVIAFICGNGIMHAMEEFVRGGYSKHSTTFVGKGSCVDEAWVIPSYHHSLDYIETVRGVPAFIVPHLWSPEILKAHTVNRGNKESDLLYNLAAHTGKKIEIIIMEPNIALFKNAWVPIIASDKLYKERPDLIEFVYAFNYPENNAAWSMADNCYLGSKLRRFKRLTVSEIMCSFNTHDSIPIFLSYQLYNSLNYLYYELLYYGYPLVHNSPDLEGCGYYYPEHNIRECVEQIVHAATHHNKQLDSYIDKARKYLKRVDPYDPDVCRTWDDMFNGVLAKNAN